MSGPGTPGAGALNRRRRRYIRGPLRPLESRLYDAAEAVAWRLPDRVRVPVLVRTLERPRRHVWSTVVPNYSMAPFVERRAIFVHVPKAAGISVSAAIFGNRGSGHAHFDAYERRFGRTLDDYFVFTFVRNPYDRLESAWRFLRDGGLNGRDRKWADENLAPASGFMEFVEHHLTAELAASYVHVRPQMEFLRSSSGGIGPRFVGRYEQLEEDFAEVCRRIGVTATLPRLNESPRASEGLGWTDVAVARVLDVYGEDFRMLGYDLAPPVSARVTG